MGSDEEENGERKRPRAHSQGTGGDMEVEGGGPGESIEKNYNL